MNQPACARPVSRRLLSLCLAAALPALLSSTAAAETFATIYDDIIAPGCVRCHGTRGNLDMRDRETAYRNLLSADTGPACAGQQRVVPGDPEASLLYQKLAGTPACGAPMPPTGPLPPELVERVRQWIADGAEPAPSPGPRS